MRRVTILAIVALFVAACGPEPEGGATDDTAMGAAVDDTAMGAAVDETAMGAAVDDTAMRAAVDDTARAAPVDDTAKGATGEAAGDPGATAATGGEAAAPDTGVMAGPTDTQDTQALAGDTAKAPAAPTAAGASAGLASDLTRDQVRQLQTALNDIGCANGPADGVLGPQTQRAIECGLRQNGIAGNNMEELYRSLNLNFQMSREK